MTDTTWVVVADRSGAALYETNGSGKPPRLFKTIEHPAGRLKDGEINTDGPGRTFHSSGPGQHRLVPVQRATQRVAADFARTIVGILDQGRNNNSFESLILVAPPRFLGRLRDALPAAMHPMVIASLDKDLSAADPAELQRHLEAIQHPNGNA